ncbi:hypothetical protein GCM10010869_10170 [Mesorhizobium tianshanense]|uniref:Uncharacterized protein (DUF2235 family) n=1 Tax=Mesorhizobium tianshanense TaxID=39844 RepID=A0A562N509_9HYPH|nr:DUF2235 domain-containing protein [Mesorhizobium tianshanense]TWI26951.1 uncharacterized protein (DUF2235 family) [Mesorhizobium tianshanense]GLS35429.1 hypothetical protein GCM10010869_10170 [Mesorhizobium tianshanense]
MGSLSTPTREPKKRLALFLDGTWNAVGTNTNVWRLRSLCADKDVEGRQQLRYYDTGVNGVVGGGWGKGLTENVQEAYNWLVENYEDGDQIFIFGFSRGAHTARSLAGFIAICGLLKPGGALGVDQLYERYRNDDERTIYKLPVLDFRRITLEERWMLKYSRPVAIEMVGVWDTVGALGIPAFSFAGVSSSTLKFHHTGLRKPIRHGFHALAIDEHRGKFAPTPWTVRTKVGEATPAPMRPIESVEQRWFVGAHANVGGGCFNDTLAQLPLRWMMQKASNLGLAFRNELELDGDEHQGAISDSYKEFMRGAYSWVSGRSYRPIASEPFVGTTGTHARVNETIDVSVFERWRDDAEYRPPNLIEWANRKKIDPADVSHSIVANSPAIAAP